VGVARCQPYCPDRECQKLGLAWHLSWIHWVMQHSARQLHSTSGTPGARVNTLRFFRGARHLHDMVEPCIMQ
jgi:hypothetical protein